MTPLAFALLLSSAAAPVTKVEPDKLPEAALVRLGSARYRGFNTDGVTFSNDGKTLYATDDKNTVFRWDAESGTPLKPITFDVKDSVCSRVRGDRAFVVEHPTPNQGAHDSIVHVFDLTSGKSRGKFDPKEYIRFTQAWPGLHRVDISADGKRFAVQSYSTQSVKVFDVSGDEPTEVHSAKSGSADKILLSPDGGRVLTPAGSGSSVIDLKTGQTCCTIATAISNAAFTPDGSKLIGVPLTAEKNGNRTTWKAGPVTVWDTTTGEKLAAPDIAGAPWQMTYHTADTLFVGRSTKDGPTIARWNLKTGKEEWSASLPFHLRQSDKLVERSGVISIAAIPTFAVSPDGKRVAISDRFSRIVLLDAATGKRADDDPNSHPAAVRWAGYSADGKAVTTATDHDVREWDAGTGEFKAAYPIPDTAQPGFVGATPDLLVWRDWKGSSNIPQELIAWDRTKRKVAWRMAPDPAFGGFAGTAGDGIVVVRGASGKELFFVYDQAGKLRDKFEVVTANHYWEGTGLSADTMFRFGKIDDDREAFTFAAYSLKSGERSETRKFPWDVTMAGTRTIASSADGKRLGFASTEVWRVFDTATGETLATSGQGKDFTSNMQFASDGSKVMLHTNGRSLVRAVELKKDGKTWTLDCKGAAASAVAFSPDGKRAVVGYRDGTALIWDVSK